MNDEVEMRTFGSEDDQGKPYFEGHDYEDDEAPDDLEKEMGNPFLEKEPEEVIEHHGSEYWNLSVSQHVVARLPMLICLLVLQSASSVILESFTDLLANHEVIVVYLTMLVGTGGNSGGQSAALVLQGLASGDIKTSDLPALVLKEGTTAVVLAFCIGCAGFLRAFIQFQLSSSDNSQEVSVADCAVIGVILFFVVIVSILVGTFLPLFFSFLQEFLNR